MTTIIKIQLDQSIDLSIEYTLNIKRYLNNLKEREREEKKELII